MSEAGKWRHIVAPYLAGNGIELATGGDPIVPTSIQFELTEQSYARYNGNEPIRGPVHWRQDDAILNLPFLDGVLDYLAASHLIEDFVDWYPLLMEWTRVLKIGGRLVICIPEAGRFQEAVRNGQPPNMAHRHEGFVGELSTYAERLGLIVIEDRLTNCPQGDYNILFVGTRIR